MDTTIAVSAGSSSVQLQNFGSDLTGTSRFREWPHALALQLPNLSSLRCEKLGI
jgi:hypothetical protein